MARLFKRSLIAFALRHPKFLLLLLCFLILSLLPLRIPNWSNYKKISLSETLGDLDHCPIEVSKPGKICNLNLNSLGAHSIAIQQVVNTSCLNYLEGRTRAGGSWQPEDCHSPFRVAIIVPYRDRKEQLLLFLQHIHPLLQVQKLDYQIFVVEQSKDHDFNRGKLFNIGSQEALKLRNFCCFIFHDVDLLPESPQNIYTCSKMPRHMSTSIDIFRYILPYPDIFGGVVAISRKHFALVNGFSNKFFGWGAEDDDFSQRLQKNGLEIVRWDPIISRYVMLSHKKAQPNPNRSNILNNVEDPEDGLIDLNYTVLDRELRPLYTWIHVNVKPSNT